MYGNVITKFPGWVDLLSYGAPLLNLDLCCVTRECLLFFSLKLAGERLKHCFKCILDASVLGTFVLTLPLMYLVC